MIRTIFRRATSTMVFFTRINSPSPPPQPPPLPWVGGSKNNSAGRARDKCRWARTSTSGKWTCHLAAQKVWLLNLEVGSAQYRRLLWGSSGLPHVCGLNPSKSKRVCLPLKLWLSRWFPFKTNKKLVYQLQKTTDPTWFLHVFSPETCGTEQGTPDEYPKRLARLHWPAKLPHYSHSILHHSIWMKTCCASLANIPTTTN